MAPTNEMEYVRLGKSGLRISKVILGAMSYGTSEWNKWVLDEEDSLPLLEYAYQKGIRTWDTADAYSWGKSEEVVGKALKKYDIPREKVVILSKCYFNVAPAGMGAKHEGEITNLMGLSRKHIIDAVDKSVARLGTYIDVLQIHRLDRNVPKEEIMRALNDVVESGKVRYIGASSMAAWEFQMLQNIAKEHGWHQFISMQDYYNLTYREEEREMIPYCHETGVGVIPWSPVARGLLTRPFGEKSLRHDTDAYLTFLRRDYEESIDKAVVGRVEEIAKKLNTSMAIIATAWCLSKGTNPIIGLNSKERIDQAVEATKFKLSEEDIKYLEEPYMPKVIRGYE